MKPTDQKVPPKRSRRRESGAAKGCRLARRNAWFALQATIVSGFLIYVLGGVALFAAGFFLFSLVLSMIVWAVLVAVHYAKYSLGQLLGAVLACGACVSLIVKTEGPERILPIMIFAGVLFLGFFFIVVQDPEWGGYRPFRRRNARNMQSSDPKENSFVKPSEEP